VQNLESSDTSLLVFGNGDGGGGPLPKMLENVRLLSLSPGNGIDSIAHLQLRRMRAVTNTHRELPPVNMGHSVDEFFDYLAESSQSGAVLPNWRGELYLEVRRISPLSPKDDDADDGWIVCSSTAGRTRRMARSRKETATRRFCCGTSRCAGGSFA
jgi:hypothetical protein